MKKIIIVLDFENGNVNVSGYEPCTSDGKFDLKADAEGWLIHNDFNPHNCQWMIVDNDASLIINEGVTVFLGLGNQKLMNPVGGSIRFKV